VVRFDRGDGINALSPEGARQLNRRRARGFVDDSETSVWCSPAAPSVSARLRPEGRRRPVAQHHDICSLRRHLKLGRG